MLASGSRDTDIVVWDVANERGLFRLRGHLGVVRRGDQMELWVDGAIDASGTCATNVPVAQRINWQLGQFLNSLDGRAGRFFFDEMV